jgi:hypothetical protein
VENLKQNFKFYRLSECSGITRNIIRRILKGEILERHESERNSGNHRFLAGDTPQLFEDWSRVEHLLRFRKSQGAIPGSGSNGMAAAPP